MKAKDIMTAPVITITPATPVHEIAALLFERRISGVPVVVANGEVVGMVSEGDLLHRHEIGTERGFVRAPWWKRLIDGNPLPAEYVRSRGGQAIHIMTPQVISVLETTPVAEVASIFEKRGIKRVPVLRDKQLVGIVSRADLIRAIVLETRDSTASRAWSDESIRVRLLAELEHQPWWKADWSAMSVTDGVVHFHGIYRGADEMRAARVAAENVPGVRAVRDDRMSADAWAPMV